MQDPELVNRATGVAIPLSVFNLNRRWQPEAGQRTPAMHGTQKVSRNCGT
jgi:hypothetical protein